MSGTRILGVPVGKQRHSRSAAVKAVGAAAAMLAAPAVAAPAARRVGRAAQGAGRMVGRGEDLAKTASDTVEKASDIKQAVSSHSSTIGKAAGLVSALRGKGSGGSKPKLSHLIEQHTDISVPRSVVYNQWTQLEMFPTISKGVESVEQQSDRKSKWTVKIGPSRRTWTGHVVEQVPDERIAWKSDGGAAIQGVVTFHSLDVDLTRVLLQMEYRPSGPVEWVGNTLRIQRRRAKRDLRLFKHFLELRGEETGSWRGRINEGQNLQPRLAGQGQVRSSRSHGSGSSSSARSSGSRASSSGTTARRSPPSKRGGPSGGSGTSGTPRRRASSAADPSGRRSTRRSNSTRAS